MSGTVTMSDNIVLGKHPDTDTDITIKKGPYGYYLELANSQEANNSKKPKRAPILKGYDADTITLEQAVKMLSMPYSLGKHPDTEIDVLVGVGKYGPYIKYDGKFFSVKSDALALELEQALSLIANHAKKEAVKTPVKAMGCYPDTNKEINIYDGKYGPYFKYGRKNYSIPKTMDLDRVSMNDIVDLVKGASKKKKMTVSHLSLIIDDDDWTSFYFGYLGSC